MEGRRAEDEKLMKIEKQVQTLPWPGLTGKLCPHEGAPARFGGQHVKQKLHSWSALALLSAAPQQSKIPSSSGPLHIPTLKWLQGKGRTV